MNRKGPVIFIVLAIIMAGAAAYGANIWLSTEADRRASQRIVTIPIVVMAKNVESGQILEANHLKLVKWPKATLPVGNIRNIKDVVGRVTSGPLVIGEPVISVKLAKDTHDSGLSAILPVGYRAVTVRVDDVIGVGGFIQAGDRVDVLATIETADYRDDPTTVTVLKDVAVLTVGQNVEKQTNEKKTTAVKVKVVTLQVTPEESERLALTATVGTLLLSLRNKGDSEHILTASSTDTKNGKPSINSQHILSGTSLARLLPQPILKKKGSPAPPPKKATFTTKKRKSRPASSTTQKSKKTGQVVEIIKGVERSIQSL